MKNAIFVILSILSFEVFPQNHSNLKFEHFSTSEGLSSSTCVEIYQDSNGFMWFGTIDGLNMYDGYEFTIYRPAIDDPYAISSNRISSIVEDSTGIIWVGTGNGLNGVNKYTRRCYKIQFSNQRTVGINQSDIINDLLYDEEKHELWVASKSGLRKLSLSSAGKSFEKMDIIHFTHSRSDSLTLDDDNVTNVVQDDKGIIWATTSGKFLNRYDPVKNIFRRIPVRVSGSYELDHIPEAILTDKEGDMILGNDLSKLIVWNRSENRFKTISPVNESIPVFHIYQDNMGFIWVATDGFGLYIIDKDGRLIRRIHHNPDDPFSLPNDQPSKILEDREGIFWIATYNKGVCKLVLSKSAFGHYFHQPGNPESLSGKIAQFVFQDSKRRIWIGTDGAGLNLFNEKEGTFTHYRHNPDNPTTLSSDKILYLQESKTGDLWVCTWDGGLNKFDPETARTKQYKHELSDTTSIGQNTVWCAVEDSVQRLWLGTQTAGLNIFNPLDETFNSYRHNPADTNSISSDFVFSIHIDSKNRLLIGTSVGLCYVELNSLNDFIPEVIHFNRVHEKNIQGVRINYILEDRVGNIWIGSDLGLHKFNSGLELLKTYSTSDGLLNNIVLGIAEDDSENLWITTKSGLSHLDPETGEFQSYNIHDGLQGIEFQSKSIEKTRDGRIIIGGINGFNIFKPNEVKRDESVPPPIISGFKLFNNEIVAGDTVNGRILLKEPVSEVNEIDLKYNEGHISINYVSMYYVNPQSVKYAYRLTGVDNDFIFAEDNRNANYSNLSPGDYRFEVRSTINDDWTDAPVTSVNIIVQTPAWKTWWAYSLYVLIFFSLFWIGIKYYTRIVREEKERDLDQQKLKFFINLSHELRTPLTLILNPVNKILESKNLDDVKESAIIVHRSSMRLLSLVNQLLDFRKMDMGKSSLHLAKGDIVAFCGGVFDLFKEISEQKNIEYRFYSNVDSWSINFDPDKIEKIMTNLLSNAFKFTEQGGKVTLEVNKTERAEKPGYSKFVDKTLNAEILEIKVKDTGVGFTKAHLNNIFRRFYHIDHTITGTGIGLNYTKGLVDILKGKITVESEHQKGAAFTVQLPKLNQIKSTEMVPVLVGDYNYDLKSIESLSYEIESTGNDAGFDVEVQETEKEKAVREKQLVLIVEDNNELRKQLVKEFQNKYRLIEAGNGAIGLEKTLKHFPDIIISDVMMPGMDGFELCRKIKSDLETCHIPVILLTARSLDEDRIAGFETGADDYIPKPFNMKILSSRILNLLLARKRLREKFASLGSIFVSKEVTTNSLDEALLDKSTKIVLDNIDDTNFNLDQLLSELAISRSNFYRKIISLTGQNPSQFIRSVRLKFASDLLLKQSLPIKEVAYKSGFNSTSYFSKTFREYFGKTPLEYRDNQNEH